VDLGRCLVVRSVNCQAGHDVLDWDVLDPVVGDAHLGELLLVLLRRRREDDLARARVPVRNRAHLAVISRRIDYRSGALLLRHVRLRPHDNGELGALGYVLLSVNAVTVRIPHLTRTMNQDGAKGVVACLDGLASQGDTLAEKHTVILSDAHR